MLAYPIKLSRDDNGTILVRFPDIPEAITFGEDESDAQRRAIDALESALSVYIAGRRPLPRPSPARGRPLVSPTLLGTMKLELYRALIEAGVRKPALDRRMGLRASHIDRLLDLNHASPIEQIETALAALGKRLVVDLRDAA
jgi:antitoxin HicB